MPTGMTFEEAAAVCDGAILALGSLRRSDLRKGQGVLVYGASGSIGTAAVQLAKEFGAYITAVCNTKNVELVRSLGADAVIDYTQEDFTKNGQTYDVIFDAVDKHSFRRCRGSLSKAGSTSQLTGGSISFWPYGPRGSETRGSCGTYLLIQEEGRPVHQGAHRGGKYRAVIDRSYPLEDVVAGTRYVETEQKTGNVVLTIYGGRAG